MGPTYVAALDGGDEADLLVASDGLTRDAGAERISRETSISLIQDAPAMQTIDGLLQMLHGDLDEVLDTQQLRDDASSGMQTLFAEAGDWLVNQVAADEVLTTTLPLIDRSLGELIAIDGAILDALFGAAQGAGKAIVDLIGASNADNFAADVLNELQAIASDDATYALDTPRTFAGILSSDVSGDVTDDHLVYNVGMDVDLDRSLPVSLSAAPALANVDLDNLQIDVETTVHLDVTFGYRFNDTLAENERGFVVVNDLSADADVAATGLDAEARIGVLGAQLDDGEITLHGELDVTLNNPDGDALGRVTAKELAETSAGNLFSVAGDASLDARFPLSASLMSYSVPDALIEFDDSDIGVTGGPITPTPTLTNLDDALNFTNVSVGDLRDMMRSIGNGLSQLAMSDLLNATDVPFARDTTLGDVADFGAGLTAAVVDPLTEIEDVDLDDGSTATIKRPTFETVQELSQQLANALGVDTSTIGLDYDPMTGELTFALTMDEALATVEAPFELGVDAGSLAELSSGGTVMLDATVAGDFATGLTLTPIEAVLSGTSNAPMDGVLGGDATFDLSVGGDTPETVTVTRDTMNMTIDDLVADFNAALMAAGLADRVAARRDGQSIQLHTTNTQVAPRLELSADVMDPIVAELGFNDGQMDSDSVADHAFIEDASLTGAIAGTAQLNGTARFGFLGVEVDGMTADIDAVAELELVDPATQTAGGRVTLGELFDKLTDGDVDDLVTDAGGMSLLDIRSSMTSTPLATASIPVRMNPNLLGPDHPDNPVITLDWPDVTNPASLALSFNSDMDRLLDFEGMDFTTVVTVLGNVADFLADELGGTPALMTELPIVDRSVADLLSFAGDFADRVEQLEQTPVDSLGQIEMALEDALGLPDSAVDLTFMDDLLRFDLDVTAEAFGDADTFAFDVDLADAIANSGSTQLQVPGGSDLVDVDAEAAFDLDASSTLNLSLGLDLSDPLSPTPVLFDSTGASFDVMANGSNLNAFVAIGPLGVFVKNGSVRLDNGTPGQPATFGVGLDPAPDVMGLPDGAYALTGMNAIAGGDIDVTVDGEAHMTLPLAAPTMADMLSPDLQLDVADLADIANTTTLTGPDLSDLADNLDLSDNLGAILDGLDLLLMQIENALDGEVFGTRLPLVGDQLADAANFVNDIRTNVLNELESAVDMGFGPVQQALFDALGPAGLNFLGDTDTDMDVDLDDVIIDPLMPGPMTDEITFEVLLDPAINILDGQSLDFDIGLPALELDVDGEIDADLGFDLALKFGVNRTDGVFFDTSVMDELTAGLDVTIPGFSAMGNLAFLQVLVEDRMSAPTSFGANFSVDLMDPNMDGRLTFEELTRGAGSGQIASASLSGGADVNLDLTASFGGNANFPSLATEFDLEWMFDTDDLSGSEPTVAFNNITLDAGEFISDFVAPVLDEIQTITGPLEPIVDFLQTEIPLLDQTLVELATSAIPGIDGELAGGFLDAVEGITDLVNSVPTMGGDVLLDLGSFELNPMDDLGDPVDIRELSSLSGLDRGDDLSSTLPGVLPFEQLQNISQDVSDFFDSSQDMGGSGSGFAFPLLENPLDAFGLLLGQDVDLVTYDMAPLELSLDMNFPLPPIPAGPATVRFELGGGVFARVDLAFGYDTSGFRLFSETGEAVDIFSGFFMSDLANPDGTGEDILEAEVGGSIAASAAVGVAGGLVEVGVEGTLEAAMGVDLRDPDGDGRVHVNEFVQTSQQGLDCTFNLVGTVDMIISVFGALATAEVFNVDVVDVRLAEIGNGGEPCFTGRFEQNELMSTAADLGAGPGIHVEGDSISLDADRDWYRFELPERDSVDVTTSFDHSLGDLSMEVYDSEGDLIERSASTSDDETVTLSDASPGEYFVLVTGRDPNEYTLSVEPAASSSTRVLYVNRNDEMDWANADDGGFYTLAPGDDANDGLSPMTPKRTLPSLLSSRDIGPDDVIVMESGTYDKPLTIGAGDGGASYFGAVSGTELAAIGATQTVLIDDSDDSLFHGLTIGGDMTAVRFAGDAANNSLHNVEFTAPVDIAGGASGNVITNSTFTDTGVTIPANDAGDDPSGNTIRDNLFDGSASPSVLIGASGGNTIESNTFESVDVGVRLDGQADAQVMRNTIDGAATGVEIATGATGLVQANDVANANTGVLNDSREIMLIDNMIHGGDVGLTGIGTLGATTIGQANELFDNSEGVVVPADGFGQRVVNNVIHDNDTGIDDQREGTFYADDRIVSLAPSLGDVDQAAIPADTRAEVLPMGEQLRADEIVVVLDGAPFEPDALGGDLTQAYTDALSDTDGLFEVTGFFDDISMVRADRLAFADLLYPSSGVAGITADFIVPGERVFDTDAFSDMVIDQLPERGTTAPLLPRDVLVLGGVTAGASEIDTFRVIVPGERFYGSDMVTVDADALAGPEPVTITDNEVFANDVGVRTGSVLGPDDWSQPGNDIHDNIVGVNGLDNAEIRFNRLHGNRIGIDADNDAFVHHNVVYDVGGDFDVDDGRRPAGIVVAQDPDGIDDLVSDAARLMFNTVHAPVGDALRLEEQFGTPILDVKHNILWAEDGYALSVNFDDQTLATPLNSDFNNLYATGDGELVNWSGVETFDDLFDWRVRGGLDAHSIGRTDVDPMRDAPRFVDPANGDYHLMPGSTSIDAGDPDAVFRDEPGPDGGRVNLGAYGNTAQAATTDAATLRLDSHRFYTDWPAEQTMTIRWSAFDVTGDVDIDVVDMAGSKIADVAQVGAGDGAFDWKPSDSGLSRDSTTQRRLRVTSVGDGSVIDTMREWFVVPDDVDTYYVDDGADTNDQHTPGAIGDDRNPGTSPDGPKASVYDLLDRTDVAPGDTVMIDTGDHTVLRPIRLGPSEAGVTFRGVGDADVDDAAQHTRLDHAYLPSVVPSFLTSDAGDANAIFRLIDADDVMLEGMWLVNAETPVAVGAGADRATIRNNRFVATDSPPFVSNTPVFLEDNINGVVEENYFVSATPGDPDRDVANSAINTSALGTVIRDNHIDAAAPFGVIASNASDGVEVVDNYITRVEFGISGDNNDVPNTLFVADNELRDIEDVAIDFAEIVIGNTVVDAGTGITGAPLGNVVRENVVSDADIAVVPSGSEGKRFITGNRLFDNEVAISLPFPDGRLAIIRGNHVYGNRVGLNADASIATIGDTLARVRDNLFYDHEEAAIFLDQPQNTGLSLFNNTFHEASGTAVVIEGNSTLVGRNNIFVVGDGAAFDVGLDAQSGFDADRNLYHITGSGVVGRWGGADQMTLADWRTATSGDTDSIEGDPMFTDPDGDDDRLGFDESVVFGNEDFGADDNFTLMPGSPAIDHGQSTGSSPTDFAGLSRHDAPATANTGATDRFVETDLGTTGFDESGQLLPFGDLMVDDAATDYNLPFTFPYFDRAYDSVLVSTNGFLEFFDETDSATEDFNTTHQLTERARIAPMFDDLDVLMQTGTDLFGNPVFEAQVFVDESASGEVTFRWGGPNDVNVSVTLFDDGAIRFDYGAGNTGLSPTVGISAGDFERHLLSMHDGASSLTDAASVRFEPTAQSYVDLGAHEFGGSAVTPLAPVVRVDELATSDTTPDLTGEVDNNYARVLVDVAGQGLTHTGVAQDGTFLIEGDRQFEPIADGVYDVTATARFLRDVDGTDATTDELEIDTTPPRVTVDRLVTSNRRPTVTGTSSETDATLTVVAGGVQALLSNPDVFSTESTTIEVQPDGTWMASWPSAASFFPAADPGVYDITVDAVDPIGNASTDDTANELIIGDALAGLTVDTLSTDDTTPPLSGDVGDPDASLEVIIRDQSVMATNNGDGTWSLADDALAPVPGGTLDVVVVARDGNGDLLGVDSTSDELFVEPLLTTVTIDEQSTDDTTPALTGTVDDDTADVMVSIDGQGPLSAINSGDGTWTLADNTIMTLTDGFYDVTVTASNARDEMVSDTTTDELIVDAVDDLDIDNDGSLDPLTDGILIIRHLVGFNGPTLTDGAISGESLRDQPGAVADTLSEAQATMLDVDDNGRTEPLTDGILIIRYLVGFSGSTLTSGAVAADAARTDPAAIAEFLNGFLPNDDETRMSDMNGMSGTPISEQVASQSVDSQNALHFEASNHPPATTGAADHRVAFRPPVRLSLLDTLGPMRTPAQDDSPRHRPRFDFLFNDKTDPVARLPETGSFDLLIDHGHQRDFRQA